jgi:RNA polymerase sigma factor (sigma-70 family)
MTDNVLLEKLKTEDNASFKLLYQFYFPSIALFVEKNSGNDEDAEDIFQEAILVLLHKVRQPDFVLTSSLKTYLYAISKNLWLKRLRDNKLILVEELDVEQGESDMSLEELMSGKTKTEKLDSWISRITANCQRILKALFYLGEPMESLMKKMQWKNKHVAANQQYKCIQQLKKEKENEQAT